MTSIIPDILEYKLSNNFTVFFYDDFSGNFIDEKGGLREDLFSEVVQLCAMSLPNFRIHLEIATIPFLVSFFLDKKEIRLATTRMGFESFLLAQYCPKNKTQENYSNFASHVDQITSLMLEAGPIEVELFSDSNGIGNLQGEFDLSTFNQMNSDLTLELNKKVRKYTTFSQKIFMRWMGSLINCRPVANLYHNYIGNLCLNRDKVSDDDMRDRFVRGAKDCLKNLEDNRIHYGRLYKLYLKLIILSSKLFPASMIVRAVRYQFSWLGSSSNFSIVTNLKQVDSVLPSISKSVVLCRPQVVSNRDADNYIEELLSAIRSLGKLEKHSSSHLTVKASYLMGHLRPLAFEETYSKVAPRLHKLLMTAQDCGVFLCFSGEKYAHRDLIFDIFERMFDEYVDIRSCKQFGITIQAYLKDSMSFLKKVILFAQKYNMELPIRLVKGEHWDSEYQNSLRHDLNIPVYINKEETDVVFHQLCSKIIDTPSLQLNLASSNIGEHVFAHIYASSRECHSIVHELMGGWSLPVVRALTSMGMQTRTLIMGGDLFMSLQYIFKRIFFQNSGVRRSHLFVNSTFFDESLRDKLKRTEYVSGLTEKFFNTPSISYVSKERRESLFLEIDRIGSVEIKKFDPFSEDSIKQEISKLAEGNKEWRYTPYQNRSAILAKASVLLLSRRLEFAQLIRFESNKTLLESILEVNEAIDYLNLMARGEIRFNHLFPNPIPAGPVAVICPSNYPLSLPVGMIAAALVSGSVVAFKSSECDSNCGERITELLYQAGVPKKALSHIIGDYSVGEFLTNSTFFNLYNFAGTKGVGLPLQHRTSRRLRNIDGGLYKCDAIASTGGNCAAVVTKSANIPATAYALRKSIFTGSGQKCSTTTRVIVDHYVKDQLVDLLKEVASDLVIGEVSSLATDIPPLVSSKRFNAVKKCVEGVIRECEEFGGTVHLDRNHDLPDGHIGPVIVEIPRNRALNTASFFKDELLGPIVHVVSYEELDQALELVNSSDFGLACAIFSNSEWEKSYLISQLEVGNIYVNQESSTEIVGAIPFGGVKLSGTGHKIGGRSYLNHFHLSPSVVPSPANIEVERGSDYQFYLCSPQSKEDDRWRENFLKSLDDILLNFESFFLARNADKKDILGGFSLWYRNKFLRWLVRGISTSNHIKSYLDLRMNTEFSLVVAYNERPDFQTFMQFLAAVATGTGVTVLTRNKLAFEWWQRMVKVFTANGFSIANLDCYFCTKELLVNSLKNKVLANIIVDGSEELIQHVLDQVYDSDCTEKRMRLVHTPNNAVHLNNYFGYVENFIRVRTIVEST